MPMYEYECSECGVVQELHFKMAACPDTVPCQDCDADTYRIISKSSIQCDSINDVPWLSSAERVIKPDHERPWSSRRDYNECMKRNGLMPGR